MTLCAGMINFVDLKVCMLRLMKSLFPKYIFDMDLKFRLPQYKASVVRILYHNLIGILLCVYLSVADTILSNIACLITYMFLYNIIWNVRPSVCPYVTFWPGGGAEDVLGRSDGGGRGLPTFQ